MKEVLIFAGTSEGRKLSEALIEAGIPHTMCVATEYGEDCLERHPLRTIRIGRMKESEMKALIQGSSGSRWGAVVDATHPYAIEVTKNIKSAMHGMEVPYLRVKREITSCDTYPKIQYFDDQDSCIEMLKKKEGNILLTTGSKELEAYCVCEEVKKRLFVRVLPGIESISLCMKNGLHGKQIIAMQGPFRVEMNEALIRQLDIRYLVTKQSGSAGGYQEKIEAAKRTGISVCVIGRPDGTEEGDSLEEICLKLKKLCGKEEGDFAQYKGMKIVLVGIGMGADKGLTVEAEQTIREADILFGADRMIQPYEPKKEKKPYYTAKQILPYLELIQEQMTECRTSVPSQKETPLKVVVLFSGDSGFYSGCKSLYQALKTEIEKRRWNASLQVLPGISSVSYLASQIGESYHDADILSMHGKELPNLVMRIRTTEKMYLLMSGVEDVKKLGQLLVEAGLTACEITTGYQLSYKEQQIVKRTPEECAKLEEEGLYVCYIFNPKPIGKRVSPGYSDDSFLRDRVPMTKEEVREVSICKLRLDETAICLDIGSGTGSIAVEMASLSPKIQVYALEQKEEAGRLVEQNKQKFCLENIKVIHTKAPEGLEQIPRATHAFIGGSGGKLHEILEALYRINPTMRVVLNAISLETISELGNILSDFPIYEKEIVQMQVSRAKEVGTYHLMQAENPIWICAFTFGEGRRV